MEKVHHPSMAENVANALEERIEAGDLHGSLPGLRHLASELGASIPTIAKATQILAARGYLESSGARRKWHITRPAGNRKPVLSPHHPKGRTGRLLFLSCDHMEVMLPDNMGIYSELVTDLSHVGWEVIFRVVPFAQAKNPRKSWDDLIALTKPDATVVLYGNSSFAMWALQRNLKVMFLGGNPGPHRLPSIGVSTGRLVSEVLKKLIDLGHERIFLPLIGRTPEFIHGVREMVRQDGLNTTKNGNTPGLIIRESPYKSPEVMTDLLTRYWPRDKPDALILLDWPEYVTAACFMKKAGINIPEDASLVLLSHEEAMNWHLPSICHYRYPLTRIVRHIIDWTLDEAAATTQHTHVRIEANWVDGDSIIPRGKS